jgi:hypothetical protein
MKQINPVSMWVNGKMVNAVLINMYSVNDNLKDSATFYYQLLSAENEVLAQGNLAMSEADYLTWNGTNVAIFNWAALQLNITLL